MNHLKKASLLAAVGFMLAPGASFAYENDPHDVVKDNHGHIVTNTFGNCVITRWHSGVDECGGQAPAPMKQHVTLTKEQRTVYFDFNKSTLNAHEKAKLDDVSRILLASREVESVDIVGYADPIGKASYNKRLSDHRAQTVRSYLAAKGLKTRNVRVEGLGETGSLANCGAVAGKKATKQQIACEAENRRVEIQLNIAK